MSSSVHLEFIVIYGIWHDIIFSIWGAICFKHYLLYLLNIPLLVVVTNCILVRVLQRNRTNWNQRERERERERENDLKEWAYVIVGAGKFEICTTGWQAGNSGKSWCCSLKSKIRRLDTQEELLCCSPETKFLFFREPQSLLLKPSFNWLDGAHPHDGR